MSGGWGFGGEVLQPVAPAPASGVSCRCPAEPGCCCVGTGVPHSCRLLEDPALWVLVGCFGRVLDTCCHLCSASLPFLWALGGT